MNHRQKLGKQGEEKAEEYLMKKGYLILDKNYHKRVGEIDLIAFDTNEKTIVFIEVKTRRNNHLGYPEEAVTGKKMEKMEKTALTWLEENEKAHTSWQLDVIAIELNPKLKITHLKNFSSL